MKYVHLQVKKTLSFELQNVAVGLSAYRALSAKENLAEHQHQSRALSLRLVR